MVRPPHKTPEIFRGDDQDKKAIKTVGVAWLWRKHMISNSQDKEAHETIGDKNLLGLRMTKE